MPRHEQLFFCVSLKKNWTKEIFTLGHSNEEEQSYTVENISVAEVSSGIQFASDHAQFLQYNHFMPHFTNS